MAEQLKGELSVFLRVKNLTVIIKSSDRLLDHTYPHPHLVFRPPVGIFFGDRQRFINGPQSLHMNLDGDDKIIDHILGEFRVATAADSIKASTDADQRVK